MARNRVTIVGQWIEFDGFAVAMLKPHAKPGELQEFKDYLTAMWPEDDVLDRFAEVKTAIENVLEDAPDRDIPLLSFDEEEEAE